MEAERLRHSVHGLLRGARPRCPAAGEPRPERPDRAFTIAGMVQFKPYFLGEASPENPRATTIQPCLRTVDIEIVGTTARHCTFFEMLGNFSLRGLLQGEGDPLGVGVRHRGPRLRSGRLVGDRAREPTTKPPRSGRPPRRCPPSRVQRLDEDNFWKMGDTGPCGPSSEIFFDRGDAFGPGGGPGDPTAEASGRYSEIWNLVFTQFDRSATGELTPLPRRNIDTGAGLDRLLTVLQGVPHVQAIDCVAPIVERAAELTGQRARR